MHSALVVRSLLFAGALAVLVNCQTLPEIVRDVCGNGVKDNGEDCDYIGSGRTNCGAPDTIGACRYVCRADADAGTDDAGTNVIACPAGYGCGTDFICRHRLDGGPYLPGSAAALGADRMFAANLAGTGQYSLLAVSRDANDQGYPRLLAFNGAGERTADQTLQGAFGLGAVADANDDGHDDVLFSRVDGLLLSLGEDATTLNAVSSDVIVLDQAHVTLLTVPGSASIAAPGARTSELLSLVSNQSAAALDATHTYLYGLDVTKGPLADFDWTNDDLDDSKNFGTRVSTLPDPAYKCERIVFAQRGGTALDSVQACCPILTPSDAGSVCANPQVRLLGGGSGPRDHLADTADPIVYGPWSLDVDGDSRTDVVVATRGLHGLQIEVAFAGAIVPKATDDEGESTRALYAAPPGGGTTLLRKTTVLPLVADTDTQTARLTELLDVGVETRDVQVVDAQNRTVTETRRFLTFVDTRLLAHATYGTTVANTGFTVGATRASGWTSARLASFNDDGLLDVIGGRARAVDLDVGFGTLDLGLNLTSVRTGLSTDQLQIADVDGDLTSDVVLASNAGGSSTLSVLFGRAGSFPTELLSLGDFERVRQIVAAPLAVGPLGEDTAADIGIVTTAFTSGDPNSRTDSVTVLRSVGGRVPFSLYDLAAELTPQRVTNASPLASALVHRAGGTDLVAVGLDFVPPGQPETFRLWSGAVTVAGARVRLAAPGVSAELAIDGKIDDDENESDVGINVLLRAIDLDGPGSDGIQEVVGITTDPTLTTPVLFVGTYAAAGYTFALPPTVIEAGTAPGGGNFYRVFGLEVVDVDADGYRDVVALLASVPSIDTNAETDLLDLDVRDAKFVVIPNRAGHLDPAAATTLATPGAPRALAVGHITGPDSVDLVVATTTPGNPGSSGIYVLKNGAFDALYTEQHGPVASARSLVVADVTGDGVDDLVIGNRDRVTVFRAQTDNP